MLDTKPEIINGDSRKVPVKSTKKACVTKPLAVSSQLLIMPMHRTKIGQRFVDLPLKESVEKAVKDLRKPAKRVSQNALTGDIPKPPEYLKSMARAKERKTGVALLAERCAKWPDSLRGTIAKEKTAKNL